MSFIKVMKDKTHMKKKQDVLHRGYEGQNAHEKEAKCPSSVRDGETIPFSGKKTALNKAALKQHHSYSAKISSTVNFNP